MFQINPSTAQAAKGASDIFTCQAVPHLLPLRIPRHLFWPLASDKDAQSESNTTQCFHLSLFLDTRDWDSKPTTPYNRHNPYHGPLTGLCWSVLLQCSFVVFFHSFHSLIYLRIVGLWVDPMCVTATWPGSQSRDFAVTLPEGYPHKFSPSSHILGVKLPLDTFTIPLSPSETGPDCFRNNDLGCVSWWEQKLAWQENR